MNIYELFGRQAELVEIVVGERDSLIALLNRIKRGEVDPDHVLFTKNGWTINQNPEESEEKETVESHGE